MRTSRVHCLSVALVLLVAFQCADAYDRMDPNGNITIKWDVVEWTADGYRAIVTMYNYQLYRHIQSPGWILGWSWPKKEVIWNLIGAETREQGDCSKFKTGLPHCCSKKPEVIDLLPGVPYNQQTANCCRGGVLSSYMQDPGTSVASFQIVVGVTGTTNTSVLKSLPQNFTLMTPGPGYTCSKAVPVPNTKFLTPDGRRTTLAFMTWNVTCAYTQSLAHKAATCCVSFSAFYNETIVPCPKCACDCLPNTTAPILPQNGIDTNNQKCINRFDPHLPLTLNATKSNLQSSPDMLYCTNDMCPVKIHWHIKLNYQEYWRVKITITNRDITRNYTLWNMAAMHPNFQNFTEAFSFSYKPLNPFGKNAVNNSAIFWGVKFYNDMLMSAGPNGNVQSEILFRKDSSFKLANGWGFPNHILFNGDECIMPQPDQYPMLPSSSSSLRVAITTLVSALICTVAVPLLLELVQEFV